ncbi:MAG: HAMP domain-containing histidine kinase [Proteobacteria bacterium]|nr:HAMP domain-containing histidine kinase [Pseudomonadota bacterium]
MVIHRPIRIKIFAISLLPVIALLFVAVINYRLLNSLGQSAERIMSRNYASIKAAQQARQVLEENRNLVLAFIFRKEPGIINNLEIEALADALAICRQHIAEIGEKNIVEALAEKYQYYKTISERFALHDSTPPTQEFMNLTAGIIADINTLVDLNERGMEAAEDETHQLAIRAQRHSLFFLCATIGLIILLIYWLSYRIAKPIRQLAQSLADSRQGGNSYPYLPVRSNDEIGLLTDQFNSLFKRLHDYDTHNTAILAAERLKVNSAEEARGRFIADLSHQLKTPMTSLAMSINLLNEKRERFPEERVAMLLETAREDCSRMINLLNELVDIARLESIIKPAVREKIDVSGLIRKCLKPLEEHAETKGILLNIEVEPDLPPITLDSIRFPWVFTNLVTNALRYTEKGGGIVIKAERRHGRFYFQCSDDGCGIEPRHMPYIFDRYTQFSERDKVGTIGLGLAIVKEIIEQHGGDIIAESSPGQGTTFTFWIPEHLEEFDAKSTAGR